MTLTPALSQGERELENSLSPWERVSSDEQDGLAMIPGHHRQPCFSTSTNLFV
jgi:hypothetical protein